MTKCLFTSAVVSFQVLITRWLIFSDSMSNSYVLLFSDSMYNSYVLLFSDSMSNSYVLLFSDSMSNSYVLLFSDSMSNSYVLLFSDSMSNSYVLFATRLYYGLSSQLTLNKHIIISLNFKENNIIHKLYIFLQLSFVVQMYLFLYFFVWCMYIQYG
jgi:hypothetical protein